jgi:hypothetical protein
MKKTLPIFILLLAFGLFSASFASAATPVYYSVSGGADTSDKKTGTPTITLSSGVATFSEAQVGNIGVGDVVTYDTDKVCYISSKTSTLVWNCVTVVGAVPDDIVDSTVVSIKRVFTSLSGAEMARRHFLARAIWWQATFNSIFLATMTLEPTQRLSQLPVGQQELIISSKFIRQMTRTARRILARGMRGFGMRGSIGFLLILSRTF